MLVLTTGRPELYWQKKKGYNPLINKWVVVASTTTYLRVSVAVHVLLCCHNNQHPERHPRTGCAENGVPW